ncbi:hypothetical protein CJF42_25540 [Pseudoalteromonas sp. NBT06-2]|uniref:hypothetical protein n=1 Tax=Pseudoalteromonas sp. NBT06-2 TaxID=2025950 RepID=UPI000BA67FA1|nr:hypothetical protein [Pseudoalteromonas sp. NBT06-2]PAJ71658.1 hypothetical protein CJF42_25540 [Pseudoalteromonas sp. NBT06-2]
MVIATLENIDVDLVYNELCKQFNVKSYRALSLAMGLSVSAVGNARGRDSLPWEGVIIACKKRGISLDKLFEIEIVNTETDSNKTQPTKAPIQQKGLTAEDLLAVNTMVDKVLKEVVSTKCLPPERELFICNKLRPVLIKSAFEHDFNEIFVRSIAEGAVLMA